MPTIAERLSELGAVAPFEKAASWDPVGLQFGDPSAPAHRLGVCHEVTEDVVAHVERALVDLLISYHPLLFQPTTQLVAGSGPGGRAYRLIRAGTALAVVHTAYDVARGGTADALAQVLGIDDAVGFGPMWSSEATRITTRVDRLDTDELEAAMSAIGARPGSACSVRWAASAGLDDPFGRESAGAADTQERLQIEWIAPAGARDRAVAALMAAHPDEDPVYEVSDVKATAGFVGRVGLVVQQSLGDLAELVSRRLGGVLRVARAGATGDDVARVAVVPGSGGGFIGAAADAGADVLVTGDVGHHQARHATERGLSIIDPGHAPTERPGVATLYAAVSALGTTEDLTSLGGGPWEEPD